jgi:hypothetical protein
LDVLAFRDQSKGTHADDVGVLTLPVQLDDGSGKLGDLARLDHFTLELEPEGFHLVDGRQLARGAHFGRELAEPFSTVGELGGDDRAFKQPAGIAGYLLENAKKLAQGA